MDKNLEVFGNTVERLLAHEKLHQGNVSTSATRVEFDESLRFLVRDRSGVLMEINVSEARDG